MTVTITNIIEVGARNFRIVYESDTEETFYVYRDGELVYSGPLTHYDYTVADGEFPLIEVTDTDDDPGTGFPCRATLHWRGDTTAAHYLIKKYVGSAWVLQKKIFETGLSWYHWTTGPIADVTTHQYEVIPVGADGNEGAARLLNIYMVRYPDPPSVTFSYDDDNKRVTITGA